MHSLSLSFLFILFLLVNNTPCQARKNDDTDLIYTFSEKNEHNNKLLVLKARYNTAVQAEDMSGQGRILKETGNLCFHLGHFPQAMEYLLDALKAADGASDKKLAANIYIDLANLYHYNKEVGKSRACLDKAYMLFTQLHDRAGIANTLGALGHFYEKQSQYDTALRYQRLALSYYQSVNDHKNIADIYENLGSIYEDLAAYDSAMYYFSQALALYVSVGDSLAQIGTYNNLGDIHRKKGQYKESLHYTWIAVSMAARQQELYQLSSGYRDLSRTYNLAGINDSAFHYAEMARSYLLKIYNIESGRLTSFYQALYDMNKKDDEIKSLKNKHNFNLLIFCAIGLILALLLTISLYVSARKKARTKAEMLVAGNEKQMLETRSKLMEAEIKAHKSEEETLRIRLYNEKLQQEKLEVELRNAILEEQHLKQEITLKTKELSAHTLHVIQKNQLLHDLKTNLESMVKDDKRDHKKQLRQVIQQIAHNFNGEAYWSEFRTTFEQANQSFLERINKYCPNLSAAELRLISLLKMNMTQQEIAAMLGISPDSLRVSRYRLRRKLNLEHGESLSAFLQSL